MSEWIEATIAKGTQVGRQFQLNGETYRVVSIVDRERDFNRARLEVLRPVSIARTHSQGAPSPF